MNCLYILEIKPLSVASFANTFSHSESSLFILFMVSFAVQKLLSYFSPVTPFIYFYFHHTRRWVEKVLAVIYVIECSAHVSL